jgi:hypothetical protein
LQAESHSFSFFVRPFSFRAGSATGDHQPGVTATSNTYKVMELLCRDGVLEIRDAVKDEP